MRFIDVHTHPGFSSPLFQKMAKGNKIDYSRGGLQEEMKSAGIETVVGIGWDMISNNFISALAQKHGNIIPVFGIKSDRLGTYLKDAELGLKAGAFRGVKILLGYESIFPNSKALGPVYRLAEKYAVPVIFHTGDTWNTYNKAAKVRYAHPLKIDDVAAEHPDMKILIAHSGNPWTEDTAEVIYKNENCYADISGWFMGTVEKEHSMLMESKLKNMVYFASSKKMMFGSDWPLIKMKKYTDFLAGIDLPSEWLENIAYKTAKKFWGIK